MLNVTQIFRLIETLRQTTFAKIKLEGKNTEKEMESVTLHTGRGDAGSTQNRIHIQTGTQPGGLKTFNNRQQTWGRTHYK